MRVLLAVHGYPPELVGGTELSVRDLARGLAGRGHEVRVVAGSLERGQGFRTSAAEDVDPASGARVAVRRLHRPDLWFDHWHKGRSAPVARAFEALVREARPDVVHVHHWLRLSTDLVAAAGRAGAPALVTLHDHHASCLLSFRVEPVAKAACQARLGPDPCIACAGALPPRTPWVGEEEARRRFAARARDLASELELARARIVPSATHAAAVERWAGGALPRPLAVVPPARAARLARRESLHVPRANGRLVLGVLGHRVPWKGADLALAGVRASGRPERFEVHLAGGEAGGAFGAELSRAARGLSVVTYGPYDAAALDRHPATAVHALVHATRAPESYGLVLDEARELGLPLVLPRAGVFVERASEGAGVRFFAPGDARELGGILLELLEPGALAALRSGIPEPPAEAALDAVLDRHLELYAEARERGAPAVPREEDGERSHDEATSAAWDEALARVSRTDLGFE